MTSDAQMMEASLLAVAESGIDIRIPLFERFFEVWPQRRASFINADAASRRMTDETLQMMFGLASGESWVWPLVAELVFTHRSYGPLPMEEYESFIDMTVEELGKAATPSWSPECHAAWQRNADALKAMIITARTDWTRIMPGAQSFDPASRQARQSRQA